MSKPWDMASVRQRQLVRKYKPCAPVGDRDKNCVSGVLAGKYEVLQFGELRNVSFAGPEHEWRNVEPEACSDCGYHVCGCPPKRIPEPVRGTELPHTVAGRVSLWEELAKRGAEFKPPRKEGFRATTDGVCRCAWCDEHDPGRTKSCDHLFSVRNGLMTPKRVTP